MTNVTNTVMKWNFDFQPPIQWVPGAISLGVTRPGVKLTTHLHLVAKSNNAWSCTSTPRIRFHGMVLNYAMYNECSIILCTNTGENEVCKMPKNTLGKYMY